MAIRLTDGSGNLLTDDATGAVLGDDFGDVTVTHVDIIIELADDDGHHPHGPARR